MAQIVVFDTGGQFAHLITRKIRECGVYCEIAQPERAGSYDWSGVKGIIISGGPASVYDPASPTIDAHIYALGIPVLGICYGMQLMALQLGGTVAKAGHGEYGPAFLQHISPSRFVFANPLFNLTPKEQRVWMSHRDQVTNLPSGFSPIASTKACPIAAMASQDNRLFGVQFHPEVAHTINGQQMLRNFIAISQCTQDWDLSQRKAALEQQVQNKVGDRHVLFFVSGGVDSAVAFKLTQQVLGKHRVHAYYIDNGLMRSDDHELIHAVDPDIKIHNAVDRFLTPLFGVVEPEDKRRIIGEAFIDVMDELAKSMLFPNIPDLVLGQGTIYPDTIESGGTQNAEVIKTHHNRVGRVQALIDEGRVVEPLNLLYKDEVRSLGVELGLPNALLQRHPFPGPGLAIRCLCATRNAQITNFRIGTSTDGWMVPIHSVGVQGDARTYRSAYAIDCRTAEARFATREFGQRYIEQSDLFNRVIGLLGSNVPMREMSVLRASLTADRIDSLRAVDAAVRKMTRETGFDDEVWQFPVVLAPVGTPSRPDSVVLRPIHSTDGMTADPVDLPVDLRSMLVDKLLRTDGICSVFIDYTPKPPSTIEWE